MNHLITENDCNATDMEDLAGAFKKPFEMFQFVYSLRALFEGNVLLAYQASSKLWSPAGAPWVSLGCSWGTSELLLGHSRGMCAPSAPRCWHLGRVSPGQQHGAAGHCTGREQLDRCGALSLLPLLLQCSAKGWLLHTFLRALEDVLPSFPNRVPEEFRGEKGQ